MSRSRLSPEARQAKLDAAHQQLMTAVGELATSEDWVAYLAVMRRFHSYSATNCLMIAMQRPDATQLGGFHFWPTIGRRVKKGAKGIAVWAPVTRRVETEDAEADRSQPKSAVARRCVGFRIAYTFDVADTEGEPLPDSPAPPCLLTGEAPVGMWDSLAAQVETAGYRIELVEAIAHSPGANGMTKVTEQLVQIVDRNRSAASMARTLCHELAHVRLHAKAIEAGTHHRARGEVEAESVAYLVCSALGLDSMTYTLPYVAGWSGGDPDRVLATATTVQRCAKAIIETAEAETSELQALRDHRAAG